MGKYSNIFLMDLRFQEKDVADNLFGFQEHMAKIIEKALKKGDPLVRMNQFVNWELFRSDLEAARENARAHERKSNAGRPATDVILLFKMCVIQSLYNLSDEGIEQHCMWNSLFLWFLGLNFGDDVPDANTLWVFRETLAKDDATKTIFLRFDAYLRENGYEARGGQIIDATIVPVPVRRDSREVNEKVKNGEADSVTEWSEATRRQKDVDARWVKKNGKSTFGDKNHVSVDVENKFVREYKVTSASVHDSQVYDDLITANEFSE